MITSLYFASRSSSEIPSSIAFLSFSFCIEVGRQGGVNQVHNQVVCKSGVQYYGSNMPHTLAQVPMLGKNLSLIPERGGGGGGGVTVGFYQYQA